MIVRLSYINKIKELTVISIGFWSPFLRHFLSVSFLLKSGTSSLAVVFLILVQNRQKWPQGKTLHQSPKYGSNNYLLIF